VNYRAEFEGPALTQLIGLPQAAFDALVERVADLVREPWDAEGAERIGIFDIAWIA
jgi:hypothetical protein